MIVSSLGLPACAEAEPRPQVVVVVDTDAPLTGQALVDAAISPDAAVDTLRVDVFDEAGNAYDYRDFVAPDPGDWPLSFGVATSGRDARPSGETSAGSGTRYVHLRIRAFRGGLATSEMLSGAAVLEPRKEIAIDRIVDLELPEEGVRTVSVRLAFDCMGVTPSFLQPRTTCVDGARLDAPATEGVTALEDGAATATAAGTAARAREVPCGSSGPPGAICIPGGFTILGDPALWGIADGIILLDSLPLRPVVVSPFLLDQTEVTVGRFRELLQGGASFSAMPTLYDPASSPYCTFLGETDPANDALPLNCVPWETAAMICEAAGGALPTEAQWEHAARGRGQARDYPWGDESPACCTASLAQASGCPGAGPEPVGSHPRADGCGGLGDVSRDDVLDLGGSLAEVLRDKWRSFRDPCWGTGGLLVDPVCEDAAASVHSQRGGDWEAGLTISLSALRRSASTNGDRWGGVRCAYPGGAP